MRLKKIVWVLAFALIAIEQGIKLVINHSYLNSNLTILKPWLYFNPVFNRHYSWVNSMLDLGVGKWPHIVLTAGLLIAVSWYYIVLNRRSTTKPLLDGMFAFIFAGAACSLIDKVFWNGSLDYIQVTGWFTFDLKDVYLNIFIGLMIFTSFFDRESLPDFFREDRK